MKRELSRLWWFVLGASSVLALTGLGCSETRSSKEDLYRTYMGAPENRPPAKSSRKQEADFTYDSKKSAFRITPAQGAEPPKPGLLEMLFGSKKKSSASPFSSGGPKSSTQPHTMPQSLPLPLKQMNSPSGGR